VLAVLSCVVLVIALVRKDWVEYVIGVEADKETGAIAWMVALLAAIAAVTFSVIARLEWERGREPTSR